MDKIVAKIFLIHYHYSTLCVKKQEDCANFVVCKEKNGGLCVLLLRKAKNTKKTNTFCKKLALIGIRMSILKPFIPSIYEHLFAFYGKNWQ